MSSSTCTSPSTIDGNSRDGNSNGAGAGAGAGSDEVGNEINNVVLRNDNDDGGVIAISDNDNMELDNIDSSNDDDEAYSYPNNNNDDGTRISIRSCLSAAEIESRIIFTSHSCLLNLCLAT